MYVYEWSAYLGVTFSFNYNNQEVRMRWNPYTDSPVYATGPILLPDFDLVKIHAYLVVEVSFLI